MNVLGRAERWATEGSRTVSTEGATGRATHSGLSDLLSSQVSVGLRELWMAIGSELAEFSKVGCAVLVREGKGGALLAFLVRGMALCWYALVAVLKSSAMCRAGEILRVWPCISRTAASIRRSIRVVYS